MPMLDFFTPDAFSLTQLTAAINNVIYKPGQIGALGLFEEAGVATLTVSIESQSGVLSLVDPAPRGAPGQPTHGVGPRTLRPFVIPHIPQTAQILADEVQGVRQFGSENQAEVFQARLDERLAIMRANIDYTLEAHRLAALKGSYYDANGTQQSLFTTFGVSQQTQAMGFSKTASSSAREKAEIVKEKVESALDGVMYSGIHVLCSPTFWKALLEDKDNKDSVMNWNAASTLRADTRDQIALNGFTFERYRGTSAVAIGDGDAYAIPLGVSGLFLTRFAPANYVETVNTIGLPYYAKGMQMDYGKGWDLESQSNPINLCTRPAAVIKLTVS